MVSSSFHRSFLCEENVVIRARLRFFSSIPNSGDQRARVFGFFFILFCFALFFWCGFLCVCVCYFVLLAIERHHSSSHPVSLTYQALRWLSARKWTSVLLKVTQMTTVVCGKPSHSILETRI